MPKNMAQKRGRAGKYGLIDSFHSSANVLPEFLKAFSVDYLQPLN